MAVVSPPASLAQVSIIIHWIVPEAFRKNSQIVSQMVHHIILADIFALLHLSSNPGQEIPSLRDTLGLIVTD